VSTRGHPGAAAPGARSRPWLPWLPVRRSERRPITADERLARILGQQGAHVGSCWDGQQRNLWLAWRGWDSRVGSAEDGPGDPIRQEVVNWHTGNWTIQSDPSWSGSNRPAHSSIPSSGVGSGFVRWRPGTQWRPRGWVEQGWITGPSSDRPTTLRSTHARDREQSQPIAAADPRINTRRVMRAGDITQIRDENYPQDSGIVSDHDSASQRARRCGPRHPTLALAMSRRIPSRW
jgi:hypothetical protein